MINWHNGCLKKWLVDGITIGQNDCSTKLLCDIMMVWQND
jgi:hypothetical protein